MTDYGNFNQHVFQKQVEEALKSVERVLDLSRNPRLAQDVEHVFEDKYKLAELLTNSTLIAQMNCLEHMTGLTLEKLRDVKAANPTKATTLRFQARDSCKFLKEQTVAVPFTREFQTTEETTTTGTFFGNTKKSSVTKIVNNITEYHWKLDVQWEISLYSGTDMDNKTVLQSRSGSTILVTQSKAMPLPSKETHHPPIDLSLKWLLESIDVETNTAHFKIEREDSSETKTPSRNKQVEAALDFLSALGAWANRVRQFGMYLQRHFVNAHNPAKPDPNAGNLPQLHSLDAASIFVPVQPLLEMPKDGETQNTEEPEEASENVETTESKSSLSLVSATGDSNSEARKESPVLSTEDITKLLDEQIRTTQVMVETLKKQFPARQLVKPISEAEAMLVIMSLHCVAISAQLKSCLGYIERMLENQLVSAIGKRVRPADLEQFVKYHNAKFLRPTPRAFCHAIRRPAHYPDGLVSIESPDENGKMEPIETHMREVQDPSPLKIPLNAATSIELTGKKYLHGWIQHRFENIQKEHKLVARARQFSSFMLVIGTMTGSDQMEPKDAIILQNKDELLIPLLSEALPTAKEFKDAIQSLSPEQQRFAKAFRSMQLESSVFGICVIQIKPQLESLLGLPEDSLTKEMKLTQDLMELFVEYQVPSDLLSFDGDGDSGMDVRSKVGNVRGNVEAVLEVIKESKTKQLEEQGMRADMAVELAMEYEVRDACGLSLPVTYGVDAEYCSSPMEEPYSRMKSKMKSSRIVERRRLAFDAGPQMMSRGAVTHRPPAPAGGSTPDGPMVQQANTLTKSTSEPQPTETRHSGFLDDATGSTTNNELVDFTLMPKVLDATIEKHDADNALRSTIIKTSNNWSRMRQKNLLVKSEAASLASSEIRSEKDKAFDLLDALSRSGSLAIACSELHVIISVTHCFERDVMDTVIQDNINPIEKLEMSTLLIASAIHGAPAGSFLRDASDLSRLREAFPALLDAANDGAMEISDDS